MHGAERIICHPHQTLALLSSFTEKEQSILFAVHIYCDFVM